MPFHPNSLADLSGKVYIVTGGNSGIGYYTVAWLAKYGAHVYLCARSSEKGKAAIATIQEKDPRAHVTLLLMDHMSLASVVAAAKLVLSNEMALHGVVNNAGIMATPFEMTQDGYEAQWQTNYIAHWVFTSHLLPLLRTTAKVSAPGIVRIVNLSSVGHHGAPRGGIRFADTTLRGESNMTRYSQSKLANVLHCKTLHQLYGPGSDAARAGSGEIWCSVVHPGFVATNLGTHEGLPRWASVLGSLHSFIGLRMDSDRGSWTNVFCVASQDFKKEQCGTYFQRIAEPGWQSKLAKDPKLAVKLAQWTEEEMKKGGWVG
ncbi:NAD(P)-binding protein [Thozetella sp. PMI_491]|nr:NAD(P)-binding protein [Thozetella sp. PMI_491]